MRMCGPARRVGRLREGEVFVSSVVSWGHPSKTLAGRSRPSLLPTASPEVGRVVLEGEGADEARITVRRQKGASWRDDVCPVEAPLLSAASGLRDRSAPSLLGMRSLSRRMPLAGGWAWADGGSVVRSPFLQNFSFGERFLTDAGRSGKGEPIANLDDVGKRRKRSPFARMSGLRGWQTRSPNEEFSAIGGLARGEIGILRHLGRRRAVGVGSLVLSWREAPKSAWRGSFGTLGCPTRRGADGMLRPSPYALCQAGSSFAAARATMRRASPRSR